MQFTSSSQTLPGVISHFWKQNWHTNLVQSFEFRVPTLATRRRSCNIFNTASISAIKPGFAEFTGSQSSSHGSFSPSPRRYIVLSGGSLGCHSWVEAGASTDSWVWTHVLIRIQECPGQLSTTINYTVKIANGAMWKRSASLRSVACIKERRT